MARILIVEDDEILGELYELTLGLDDHETTIVGNAEEGLAALSSAQPDLVILDEVLPSGDQLDLLREIRSRPLTSRTPVILATGLSREEFLERGGDGRWDQV